jgi:hypothetical protein
MAPVFGTGDESSILSQGTNGKYVSRSVPVNGSWPGMDALGSESPLPSFACVAQ